MFCNAVLPWLAARTCSRTMLRDWGSGPPAGSPPARASAIQCGHEPAVVQGAAGPLRQARLAAPHLSHQAGVRGAECRALGDALLGGPGVYAIVGHRVAEIPLYSALADGTAYVPYATYTHQARHRECATELHLAGEVFVSTLLERVDGRGTLLVGGEEARIAEDGECMEAGEHTLASPTPCALLSETICRGFAPVPGSVQTDEAEEVALRRGGIALLRPVGVELVSYRWACGGHRECERAIGRDTLAACDPGSVLVLSASVESIARDAVSSLSLKGIVVDVKSKSMPEDCDFGREGETYKHVPVFRIDTSSPPLVSLPDTVFKSDYDIPVLLHSMEETSITIDDKSLLCSRCIHH